MVRLAHQSVVENCPVISGSEKNGNRRDDDLDLESSFHYKA